MPEGSPNSEVATPATPVVAEPGVVRPARLPADELASLATDYGLDPTRYRRRAELIIALSERRDLIATISRAAMLEVVRWGRRPVPADVGKEQLAKEIARIQRWKYDELSRDGLEVLARLRGHRLAGGESSRELIKKLRRGDGMFARLNRSRRAIVASAAAKIVGDEDEAPPTGDSYKFLPSEGKPSVSPDCPPPVITNETLRERIEERGLFGGIADRVRRSADSYVNQKLDEIEARIDRKLDEIDKRLGEWRDKEIANRVRILKITLWASVIVSIVSLVYAYLREQVF